MFDVNDLWITLVSPTSNVMSVYANWEKLSAPGNCILRSEQVPCISCLNISAPSPDIKMHDALAYAVIQPATLKHDEFFIVYF